MPRRVEPLGTVPIVDPNTGAPTPEFQRKWARQHVINIDAVTWREVSIVPGDGLDGGGLLSTGTITLTADVQEILDQISSTRGVVLYRGASAWAALSPGTSGHFLKTNGAGADPAWDAPSAGDSGGYFAGFHAEDPTASGTSFATKGVVFVPSVDISVSHVLALIDQAATGDSYKAVIASLASITASGLLLSAVGDTVTVLGTSTGVSSGSTNMMPFRFPFSSPLNLVAGTAYVVAVIFDQGSGTAVNRVGGVVHGAVLAHTIFAPGITYMGALQYNTVGLSASQAVSTLGTTNNYAIGLEGTPPATTDITGAPGDEDDVVLWDASGNLKEGPAVDSLVRDTGDETIAGIKTFSSTPVVPDASFALAKIANIATARILGRNTAGAGVIEELPAATAKTVLALVKADVGLGSVDNTSDAAKPVSTAQQTALDLKANLAGATFVGDIVVPAEVYGAGWDASNEAPTKNDLYDKIQTIDAKLTHITVTQAVDLDAIESRVNALDASVILMGLWDASAGTFPGGGTAQAGESWIVSVTGTVDGVVFTANDRIIAILDNASTATYAANWHKADYTDQVLSVAGQTGVVVLTKSDVGLANVDNTSDAAKPVSTAQQTALDLKANLAGATFSGDITVPPEAYGAGWDGSNEAPTKNDIYDKIQTLGGAGGGSGTAVLNFGAFPGSSVAYVDAVAVGVVSTSLIEAWIRPVASADHSDMDHVAVAMRVVGTYLSDGNIRIFGLNTNDVIPPLEFTPPQTRTALQATRPHSNQARQNAPMLVGQFNVNWKWS